MATDGDWKSEFRGLERGYVKVAVCGRGTYGSVYKVRRRDSNDTFYAIKKICCSSEKEGFPLTAIREIALLQRLKHPNIIALKEIIDSRPSKRNAFRRSCMLVLEYMEHDFLTLSRRVRFSAAEVKRVMLDALSALAYLHGQGVIHRDIKGANLLLNARGEVKLADFGLARLRGERAMTQNVVTFWYRAPELLLGLRAYDEKIDLWALGCVMAELMTGDILFTGRDAAQQLALFAQRLGPIEAVWPEATTLPYYGELRPPNVAIADIETVIGRRCPWADSLTLDFLRALLAYNPKQRLSASAALAHPFFGAAPPPCSPRGLTRFEGESHRLAKGRSEGDNRFDKSVGRAEDLAKRAAI